MYNNNNNNDYLSKFTYAVHPSGFLPLSGGVMSGYSIGMSNNMAKIQSSSTGAIQFDAYDTANDSNNRRILLLNSNNKESNLNKALRLVTMIDGADTYYNMYGEHNKPSKSYTGNGSATERKIPVGGIGNVLFMYNANYFMFVWPSGAIAVGRSGTVTAFENSELRFYDGYLTIASTSSFCNGNGVEYPYISF